MCTCLLHTKVDFEWFLYMYAYVHTNGSVWALSVIYSDFVADALWQFIDFFKSKFFFFSYILYILLNFRKAKNQIVYLIPFGAYVTL